MRLLLLAILLVGSAGAIPGAARTGCCPGPGGEDYAPVWSPDGSTLAFISLGGGDDAALGQAGDDVLIGGKERDRLIGGEGADLFYGEGSGDVMLGGPGQDRLHGGRGEDRLLTADGEIDTLDCGSRMDSVVADQFDRVSRNCERVRRRRR